MKIIRYLIELLDWLVPRFITEECAVNRIGYSDLWDIECCMDDIEAGEVFDGIATMRCFTWFGIGFFPVRVGPIKPWVNPKGELLL